MNNDEDKAAIRQTVEELLKHARSSVNMAEHYEDEAKSFLVSVQYVLKSLGIEKTAAELRAMLAKRKGVYTAEAYAALVAEELLPKPAAAEPAETPAEVRT